MRDVYSNEYVISVYDLDISSDLKSKIVAWAVEYKRNQIKVNTEEEEAAFRRLDELGLEYSFQIMKESKEYKVDYYYSDYFGTRKYLSNGP